MDYSASDFEKKYATNTEVLEQALQYIADDLELECRFTVSEDAGRIKIAGKKECRFRVYEDATGCMQIVGKR